MTIYTIGKGRQVHSKRVARAFLLATVVWSGSAIADAGEVSLARQFGDSYLPLMVMEKQKLIEKQARKQGLGDVKVTWKSVSGGAAANDALLSGQLDFVSGGVGPLLTAWAATGGKIKGVSALNTMPLYLNTNNPNVRTLKDFTERDKIAVPAVRVSMQAVLLRMAVAKAYGEKEFDKLDKLTVSMKQADATLALMSGSGGLTAHFGNSPFQFRQLENPKIRTVINSFDILDGPATFGVVWTTSKFHDENPKLYQAVFDALGEAINVINADKLAAGKTYLEMSKSKTPLKLVQSILENPKVTYSQVPLNTFKMAQFMYKVHQIKLEAHSWKDYFFPEVHKLPGG